MKKQMKKTIAVLLSVLLCCSALTALPVSAFAATTAEQTVGATSGTTGDCTWKFDEATGTLTISGNGKMEDYVYFEGVPWEILSVKQVVIENGVTSIGSSAFKGCTGLTSVSIGNSVTSIGNHAFESCTGLTSVTIPNSVTSIGEYAFSWCEKLTSVTIPDSVTSIGRYAFYYCTGLKSVTIPDSVKSIDDYAFSWCEKLTSVTIPDSVTSIGCCAFFDCTSLTSITIPDSVTSIGEYAFADTAWYDNQPDGLVYAGKVAYEYKGTRPAKVEIEDGTLGIAGYAFYKCDGLTNITIPNSVTSIGRGAFKGCTGLTSVTIPNSVTSIGYYAFGYFNENGDKKIDNFTIYGSKGSAAEAYANENGFKFIEMSNFIEKTDEDTGVSISLPEDLTLRVNDATDSDSVKNIVLTDNETLLKAFDITLLKNGKKTQPDGSVTVRIPCDKENAKVYRVEADNTMTDMHAVYQDGFMVFTTNHFSVYVLAAPKTALIGDVNGDGKVNGVDSSILARYLSAWDGYNERIKSWEAADLDRNGTVNGKDSSILKRYLSAWDGYDKYIITFDV